MQMPISDISDYLLTFSGNEGPLVKDLYADF